MALFEAGDEVVLPGPRWVSFPAAVAVVPGAAFGADEHVRISFACSRETLEEGLDRMAEFLGA